MRVIPKEKIDRNASWFNIFIMMYLLALFVFIISLFGRLQTQVNDIEDRLDILNLVITVGAEAPQEKL